MNVTASELTALPGAEIVLPGLDDLQAGVESIDAASVLVARSRTDLFRFPAVDAPVFREKLEAALR